MVLFVRQVSSSGVGWQPTVYDAYHHVMRVRAAAVGGLIGRVAPHRQCCAVDAGFRPTTRPGGVRKMGARPAFDPWARMPITTARNGTSIAHAATRCMRVCTIFQRLRTKTTEAPSPSQRSADAVLVVKANTLVILQYVSRLHGPQLFMKAGPGRRLTHNIVRRCCTVCCAVHAAATMIIAVVEGGAAACLDALRANEKAGTAGFLKSNPPRDTWRAVQGKCGPWTCSLDCA